MNIILGKGRIIFNKTVSDKVIWKVVDRLKEEEEDIHEIRIDTDSLLRAGSHPSILFEMSGDKRINYDPLKKILNEFKSINMGAKVKEYIEGETGFDWKSKEGDKK